jgi:hypothetical protein
MGWWLHYAPTVLAAGSLVLGLDVAARWWGHAPPRLKAWQPAFVVAALVAVAGLMLIRAIGGGAAQPFIYGQF